MPGSDWSRYLDAAERKAQIAAFHAEQLSRLLEDHPAAPGGAPPVPVQAYFEGTVVSVVAAIDQVAQAVNSARRLRLDPTRLVAESYAQLRNLNEDIGAWYDRPLGRDLRRIRTRAVHYTYQKQPRHLVWAVEDAGVDYLGDRELGAYASVAVTYCNELIGFIPEIRAYLTADSEQAAES